MSEFQWKLSSLLKGIDPNLAFKEFERIKNANGGELTAKILLNASRSKDSVFHPYFNWNDADAAEKYRLRQAGDLIRNIQVHVITDGEPKNVRVYEVVKKTDQGYYKNIESLTTDDIDYIRIQTVKALTSYRNKLSLYDQFKISVKHIDNAISELELVEQKKQQVAA